MKKVLTIAGSDSSGGAGIQADIKTIAAHKMYAMSVITSLTAQNTTGVFGIMNVGSEFVGKQIDAVFTDIFPDAVKIGMVSEKDIIEMISAKIKQYKPGNIVIDPVMVATSGAELISAAARQTLISELFPLASVITPNIPEAEVISGMKIGGVSDMKNAAEKIFSLAGVPVLVKGGHSVDDATDILYDGIDFTVYRSEHINNPNTHGTGCTLSSAIACGLASGTDILSSVKAAKAYVTGAIKAGLAIGCGHGPLDHMYNMN